MLNISENTLVKILKYGVYASLIWFFLIARNALFPAQSLRVIFLQILVEILAVFYVALILKYPKRRPKLNLMTGAIAVWAGALILSAIFGADFWASIFSQFERMTGIFIIAHFIVFFLILIAVFKTWPEWRFFFAVNVAIGAIQSFFALYQKIDPTFLSWLGDTVRVSGLFSNPSLMSSYLIFPLFLALFLFFKLDNWSENWGLKSLSALSFLSIFSALFFTETRGSIAGSLLGIAVFLFIYLIAKNSKKTRIIVIGILAILFLTSIFLWINKDKQWASEMPVVKRFANMDIAKDLSTRIIFWTGAWKGFKERPILGWGPENFNLVFAKHYNPVIMEYGIGESISTKPHNIFLEYLADGGIVGLASYLAMFFVAGYLLFRKFRADSVFLPDFAIFVSLFLAHLAQNMLLFDTNFTYYMLFGVLGYVAFISFSLKSVIARNPPAGGDEAIQHDLSSRGAKQRSNLNKYNQPADSKDNDFKIVAIVLMFFLSGFLIYANINTYKAILRTRALDDYSYKISPFYDEDLRTFYLRYYLDGSIKFIDDKETRDALLKLDLEFEKIVKDHPLNLNFIVHKLQLMLNLSKYDKNYLDKVEKLTEEKLVLYPNSQYLYLMKGGVAFGRSNYKMAIENYRKAVELNYNSLMPHWFLGFALHKDGQREEALKEFDFAYARGYTPMSNAQIGLWAQIYGENKIYDKALQLYNEAINKDPENYEYLTKMAAIYKELGNKELAIGMANRAVNLNPDLKEEVEAFIKQVEKELK